jgi:hypothetical protein
MKKAITSYIAVMALVAVLACQETGRSEVTVINDEPNQEMESKYSYQNPNNLKSDKTQNQSEHHGPPPEAIKACEGKTKGDSCEFKGRRKETVKGTCQTPRAEELVCFPEGGPPDQKGGQKGDKEDSSGKNVKDSQNQGQGNSKSPPPEAVEACNQSSEGDSCAFKTPRGEEITGICRKIQASSICVPDNHKPGGSGSQGKHR